MGSPVESLGVYYKIESREEMRRDDAENGGLVDNDHMMIRTV